MDFGCNVQKKKKSSKLPLTLTCCLFFLFCLFFLLCLKLQRSDDDDAENALWVCSSAGAAQRHHPSERNGGKRVRAIPTPLTPFGLLVVDPPHLKPASLLKTPPKKISDNIGFSKKNNSERNSEKQIDFVGKRSFIGFWFANAPPLVATGYTSPPPTPPSPLRQIRGGGRVWASLVLQMFCLVDVGLQLPHLAIEAARQRRNQRPCQAQGHAGGIMVHWGDGVGRGTRRALTSVAPALQGPFLTRNVRHPRLGGEMSCSQNTKLESISDTRPNRWNCF